MKNGTYHEALEAGFNPNQAGMLSRLGIDLKSEVSANIKDDAKASFRLSLFSRLARAFVIYTVDMSLALFALVLGFGLEVKNWPAVLAIGIFTRFFFHVVIVSWAHDDAREAQKRL